MEDQNNRDNRSVEQESAETNRPESNSPQAFDLQHNNIRASQHDHNGPSTSGLRNNTNLGTNHPRPNIPTSIPKRPSASTRSWSSHSQSNRSQSTVHQSDRPHQLSTRPKSSRPAHSPLGEKSTRPNSVGDEPRGNLGRFRKLFRDLKQKISLISVKLNSKSDDVSLDSSAFVGTLEDGSLAPQVSNGSSLLNGNALLVRQPARLDSPQERDVGNLALQPPGAGPLVPLNPPEPRVHTTVDFIHCLVPHLTEVAAAPYYWGVMDRYEAERLLDNKPEGTFLLRDSSQDEFLFSVSFRRYSRSLHARVEQWNHKFSFDYRDDSVYKAPSINKLLEHYNNPNTCMFFEPMLTDPLHRPKPFSLKQLVRSVICDNITYDSITYLPLPQELQEFLRRYHYKQRVRVRTHDETKTAPVLVTVTCT